MNAELTQKQVRAQIGIPQSTLAEIETTATSSGYTAQLAALYKVDAYFLATGESAPPHLRVAAPAPTAVEEPAERDDVTLKAQSNELAQALSVLGEALRREMPEDVRQDVADLLAKMAERRGAQRSQDELVKLLTGIPVEAPAPAHGALPKLQIASSNTLKDMGYTYWDHAAAGTLSLNIGADDPKDGGKSERSGS